MKLKIAHRITWGNSNNQNEHLLIIKNTSAQKYKTNWIYLGEYSIIYNITYI